MYLENESKKLQEQEQAKYDADRANEKKFLFHQQSMIADSNIKEAKFYYNSTGLKDSFQ